jgi:hypothetical protein
VWTPRRVLMLIKGVILCLVGYAVYAFCLGSIDGLPPLPPEFLPIPGPDEPRALTDRERTAKSCNGQSNCSCATRG